jgi:pyruvyltransferase
MLVERILASERIDAAYGADKRLLTVGSIMHFAKPGDVVWGTGINGKRHGLAEHPALDVRAVRGPLTRRILQEAGNDVPEVYGDPGLLWSRFWPREHYAASADQAVGIVPNLHDWPRYSSDPRAINPRGEVHEVISRIARCEFIASTSLHGLVIAESFGIPARLVPPSTEPMHKYHDYYGGTGRPAVRVAATVDQAIEMGGETPPDWDGDALLGAFPLDLWR